MEQEPTYICMLVSRHKDNQDVAHFKPREKVYLTHTPPDDEANAIQLIDFTKKGRLGEKCRMYYSVNARDVVKTQKALQHYLLDYQADFVDFENKLVSLAGKPENALTHHWLLDVDTGSEKIKAQIETYLRMHHPDVDFNVFETINGYSIVVEHGFDTRGILNNFPQIELKRDAMLLKSSLTLTDD